MSSGFGVIMFIIIGILVVVVVAQAIQNQDMRKLVVNLHIECHCEALDNIDRAKNATGGEKHYLEGLADAYRHISGNIWAMMDCWKWI